MTYECSVPYSIKNSIFDFLLLKRQLTTPHPCIATSSPLTHWYHILSASYTINPPVQSCKPLVHLRSTQPTIAHCSIPKPLSSVKPTSEPANLYN